MKKFKKLVSSILITMLTVATLGRMYPGAKPLVPIPG